MVVINLQDGSRLGLGLRGMIGIYINTGLLLQVSRVNLINDEEHESNPR
jgi:hypothetical protein